MSLSADIIPHGNGTGKISYWYDPTVAMVGLMVEFCGVVFSIVTVSVAVLPPLKLKVRLVVPTLCLDR
jgi:hypothetical protein